MGMAEGEELAANILRVGDGSGANKSVGVSERDSNSKGERVLKDFPGALVVAPEQTVMGI